MTDRKHPVIRAVVFDFDGTLADTLRDIADAVNHALSKLGFPTHPVSRYRDWVGDGLARLCRRAMAGKRTDRSDDVTKWAGAYYREHSLDHTALYPGVPELLDELKRREIPLGILSNKPHDFTVRMADALCARWRFEAVEGCGDDALRKPDPRVALQICAEMGVEPSRTVFVGDTAIDIATARNAEMVSVGVTWGFRDRAELRDAGADHIIDVPGELLTISVLRLSGESST
jgi:phosphoglycolate phosphatase